MGKRVQRIPSWPGVKRFTPTKAVYICADQLVTSSHFACGEAADHTFRFADNPRSRDSGVVLTGSLIPRYTPTHSGQTLRARCTVPKRVPPMYSASLEEGGFEP